MFAIPEHHIDKLVAIDNLDATGSLIEECSELIQALSKAYFRGIPYDLAVENICMEMAHVLISMNLVARQLNLTEKDIFNQVLIKAADSYFDLKDYIDE